MALNASQAQNTYMIPGKEAGSLSDQAEFDQRFQDITRSDEQLRALQEKGRLDGQSLNKNTTPSSSMDQQTPDIVGGDPLLSQLEKDATVDRATAAVHERIATRANKEQRMNERSLVLNIADRLWTLRAEHDVVDQAR